MPYQLYHLLELELLTRYGLAHLERAGVSFVIS